MLPDWAVVMAVVVAITVTIAFWALSLYFVWVIISDWLEVRKDQKNNPHIHKRR